MANLAAVMAEALRKSEDGKLPEDTDLQMAEAARKDLSASLSSLSRVVAEADARPGSRGIRRRSMVTVAGKTDLSYRHVPGLGSDPSPGMSGCVEGASRTAMRRCAKIGATLGSFDCGAKTIDELCGIDISAWKLRKLTLLEGGRLYKSPPVRPEGFDKPSAVPGKSIAVEETVVISTDGTCVPCVKADTRGVTGKNGKPAKSRELKVGMIGVYSRLTKKGRVPIIPADKRCYSVSFEGADDMRSRLRAMDIELGTAAVRRVQFIADGADWIEAMAKDSFKNAEFTIDFYHACSYLSAICSVLGGKDGPQLFKEARRRMKQHGAKTALKYICRLYPDADKSQNEDVVKGFRYIRERIDYMQYGRLRREGFLIGSGHIESACKSIVGERCKLAGAHWRHKNAAYVAAIRAAIKSNTFDVT